ncbi:hypothetical protein BH23VER1_BH23VER1_03270 [soil metagenome]
MFVGGQGKERRSIQSPSHTGGPGPFGVLPSWAGRVGIPFYHDFAFVGDDEFCSLNFQDDRLAEKLADVSLFFKFYVWNLIFVLLEVVVERSVFRTSLVERIEHNSERSRRLALT